MFIVGESDPSPEEIEAFYAQVLEKLGLPAEAAAKLIRTETPARKLQMIRMNHQLVLSSGAGSNTSASWAARVRRLRRHSTTMTRRPWPFGAARALVWWCARRTTAVS